MSTERKRIVFSGVAVLAAGLAASLPGAPVGLNVVIAGWVLLVAVFLELRTQLTPVRLALLGVSATLFAAFLFRSAEWLWALDVIGALAFAAWAALGVTTWRSLLVAATGSFFHLPKGVVFVLGPLLRWTGGLSSRRTAVLRTAGIVSLLLLVFGSLFASADAAFASLAERYFVPEIEVGLLPARFLLGAAAIAAAGSLSLLPSIDVSASPWRLVRAGDRVRLSPAEWISGLVAIDLLFGAFVAVQIRALFGGHDWVLETAGLAYAHYARQGFFQLVVVAVLTLGVIALAVRFARVDDAARRWMRLLLGTLCILTLVILASAWIRMNLYQEAYGFTRLRILVDLTILWLAAVFLAVIVAGARWKAAGLPRAVVALAAVALVGLNAYDPDARIASLNIARYERTGKLDLHYLEGLSLDAVPALDALADEPRRCAFASMRDRLEHDPSLWSFNVARERARGLLQGEPALMPGPLTC